MKRILLFACLASAMSAFTSCTNDPEVVDSVEAGSYSLKAVIAADAETRSQLGESEGKSYAMWTAGDEIGVYNGTEFSKYTLREGSEGLNGMFDGTEAADAVSWSKEENGAPYNVAVYPASTAWISTEFSGTGKGWVGAVIPTAQKYAAGSFAEEAMPMVAVWTEEDGAKAIFKPAGSIVHLQLWADAPTTLENVQFFADAKQGTNAYKAAAVAGNIGIGMLKKHYAGYNDPATPYLATYDMWAASAPFYTVQMPGGTDKTITIEGPIELSTDEANPTSVYIVVSPANYNGGFVMTMNESATKQMVKEAPAQAVTILHPGKILEMPAIKYEGEVVDNTLNITEMAISCDYPYIMAVEKGAHPDDNLPVWTVEYGSVNTEIIDMTVTLDKPKRGVKFMGTESQSDATYNQYKATEGTIMAYMSGSQDMESNYHLYMKPNTSDQTSSREETLTLVSGDGAVTVGYVKLVQAGSESIADPVFQSVTYTTDNVMVTYRDYSNLNSIQVTALSTGAGEGTVTIQTGLNNKAQANGLSIEGLTLDNNDWQTINEWLQGKLIRTGADTFEVHVKLAASSNEAGRNISFDINDSMGRQCCAFGVAQPGSATEANAGIYLGSASSGTLVPIGEVYGQAEMVAEESSATYDFYHSYELTLAGAGEVTSLSLSGSAAIQNADPDPQKNSASFTVMYSDADWIDTFEVGDGLDPTMTSTTIKGIHANATSAERRATVSVGLRGSNLKVGTLTIIQPAAAPVE